LASGRTAAEIKHERVWIEEKLRERGYRIPRGGRRAAPSLHAMLNELSRIDEYATYMRLSKPVHGALGVRWIYRHGPGGRVFEERIDVSGWRAETYVVWRSLDLLTQRLIDVLVETEVVPADDMPFVTADVRAELDRMLGPRKLLRAGSLRKLRESGR
jgi:hypothetical protein